MSSVTDFYNTLLSSEIAVFGIMAAALIVFTQMVYGQLSHRAVRIIFGNWLLWMSVILSATTLSFTAMGSLLLSFPSYDFIPQYNFGSRVFFQNGFAGLAALALFIASNGLFILLVVRNWRFLRPSSVALLIGRQVRPDHMKAYLLNKYGVPNPDEYPYLLRLYKSLGLNDPIGGVRIVFTGEEQNDIEKETQEEGGGKARIVLQKLVEYRTEYKKLSEKKDPVEHPLGLLSTLMIRALDAFDMTTIEETI